MKIPKQFPQFENKPTLFAVFGSQRGIFYMAENGIMEKVNEIEVITPRYSDKEGYSEIRSPRMGVISRGSSREIPKEKIHKEFIKKAANYTEKVRKKGAFKQIYLFCSPEIINQFKDYLGKTTRGKISKEIRGIFIKKRPIGLLKLI